MLDGLSDDEVNQYLEEHPKVVPLFEVDIVEVVTPYITHREDKFDEPDWDVIRELQQTQESLEHEMAVSQRMKASQLEEVDLGTSEAPKLVSEHGEGNIIGKENGNDWTIQRISRCVRLVIWRYARVGSPTYQHKLHLNKDVKPIAQRRYRMNPNYVAKSKKKLISC